jgi:uncharacterized coiled-coil protein SlyX
MTLAQILKAIADFIKARLNALKGKIAQVEQTVQNLNTTITQGLAARYTKTEADAKFLDKTATAVNSAKLEGFTKAEILAEAAGTLENVVQELRSTTVKDTIVVPLVTGGSYDLLTILGNANLTDDVHDDGTVYITINGDYNVSGNLTSANGNPMNNGGTTQAIKSGDQFVVKLNDGIPTSVQYAPSATKAALDAIHSEQVIQDGRLTTLEGLVNGPHPDYVTNVEADDKIRLAFDAFRIELAGWDYTDPN